MVLERFVDDLVRAAAPGRPIRVHVKLDTGMGRLGTRELDRAVVASPSDWPAAPRPGWCWPGR